MNEPMFRVTDLKQYAYCPRIIYYHACLPDVRPTTYNMEAGREAHAKERLRERRRGLRVYGLPEGERHFGVELASKALELRGRVDMVVRTADEAIPVEYKDTRGRGGSHWELQLAAYGMMLEEKWGLPVRRGFLYSIPNRRAREVKLTARLRSKVRAAVEAMQRITEQEEMPEPAKRRAQCIACEFRRFCNDVL